MGKSWENHGKIMENMGNHGKIWEKTWVKREYHGEIVGKSWENQL
jgi:hypothetical protein